MLRNSYDEAQHIASQIQQALKRWGLLPAIACMCWVCPGTQTLHARDGDVPACTRHWWPHPPTLSNCLSRSPPRSGEHPEEQIAVLLRTHIQARLLEQELVSAVAV